jgi:hypothetical protein
MTKTYMGCDLYRLEFDSNVDVQLSESEIKEIVEEFIDVLDIKQKNNENIDSILGDIENIIDRLEQLKEEDN